MNKLGLSAGRPSANRKTQTLEALADKSPTVRVNFDLPDEEHMRLKMHAVKSRVTVSKILRDLIDQNIPKLSD